MDNRTGLKTEVGGLLEVVFGCWLAWAQSDGVRVLVKVVKGINLLAGGEHGRQVRTI